MLSRRLESEGRWVHALLVLSTVTVALVLLNLVAGYVVYFNDVLIIIFSAWLFAFILSPLVSGILRRVPALPRIVVVVFVYGTLFVVLSAGVILLAANVAGNVQSFIADWEQIKLDLPETLAPWQAFLDSLNIDFDLLALSNNLSQPITDFIEQNPDIVNQGFGLLGGILGTTFGIIGNLLLIVFLSLFIVIDKEAILAFMNRLVPPRYADEAKLFETSVVSSFGGFLRGQFIQGLVYGAFAAVGSIALGIDYWPLTTALVVILQIIPFFGPFFSWAPPVVAAVLTEPSAVLPIFIVQAIGWFITMNIVQPRVMSVSVGVHPIVVLLSLLVGIKLYGPLGAVFAVPVAAVISAFFFHFLARSAQTGTRDVASRAARRLEEREGRKVRVPAPPDVPGGAGELPGRLNPTVRPAPQPPDAPA
jgi:predicted PurR-regulated permease PerM